MSEQYKEMLKQAGILKYGHFKLTSGKHAAVYVSKDDIYWYPGLFRETVNFICEMDHKKEDGISGAEIDTYDAISEPAIAGAILAGSVALLKRKHLAYPKKVYECEHYHTYEDGEVEEWVRCKVSMQLRRGYDEKIADKRVLLVEDIITTGGSVIETIGRFQECGAEVVEVRCIWNRTGFQIEGIPVHAIVDEKIDSWEPDKCPICHPPLDPVMADGYKYDPTIPLTDPKTMKPI